jgi:hypothetical protein
MTKPQRPSDRTGPFLNWMLGKQWTVGNNKHTLTLLVQAFIPKQWAEGVLTLVLADYSRFTDGLASVDLEFRVGVSTVVPDHHLVEVALYTPGEMLLGTLIFAIQTDHTLTYLGKQAPVMVSASTSTLSSPVETPS